MTSRPHRVLLPREHTGHLAPVPNREYIDVFCSINECVRSTVGQVCTKSVLLVDTFRILSTYRPSAHVLCNHKQSNLTEFLLRIPIQMPFDFLKFLSDIQKECRNCPLDL